MTAMRRDDRARDDAARLVGRCLELEQGWRQLVLVVSALVFALAVLTAFAVGLCL